MLPTEDLENECLTSLVGQIFSELIIGNLVSNKLSEPWLLLEIFIMLTRLTKGASQSTDHSTALAQSESDKPDSTAPKVRPVKASVGSSMHQLFWSMVQWGFLVINAVRLVINILVLSRSLPPRSAPFFVKRQNVTDHHNDGQSFKPLTASASKLEPVKAPIADFKIWSCIGNLLEMDARMPWLNGAISMLQWCSTRGPGRVAGYDGVIDR